MCEALHYKDKAIADSVKLLLNILSMIADKENHRGGPDGFEFLQAMKKGNQVSEGMKMVSGSQDEVSGQLIESSAVVSIIMIVSGHQMESSVVSI